MKKDIFDRLTVGDIFDRVKLDLFDTIELDPEDKIIYSEEMRKLIREELANQIAKIPVGEIIAKVLNAEVQRQAKENGKLKSSVKAEVAGVAEKTKKEMAEIKSEISTFQEKIRKRYDDLKNEILSAPKYTFGGFAPPNPTGHAGQVLTTDGTWSGISWAAASGGSSPDVYTVSNLTTTRAFDATSTSMDELANVLGSLIVSLQGAGILH